MTENELKTPREVRYFSLAEANNLIPLLEFKMGQLQKHFFALQERLEALSPGGNSPLPAVDMIGDDPLLRRWIAEIQDILQEFNRMGLFFKSPELGLIDFPTRLNDEVVYLCWQFGEKTISHYHGIKEGFAGRKPLEGSGWLQKPLH